MLCDLPQYLDENFPRLFLHGPLFYRWRLGLRFDLGGRATAPEEIDVVVDRATSLYESLFATEDTAIVVAQDWPGDESPPTSFHHLLPLFVFAERENVGLQTPDGQVKVDDPEELEAPTHSLTWVVQPAGTFRYDLVFAGLANADHGRSPAISSRVYLIKPVANVIFHMYDDRGLDVIAREKDAIRSLYSGFNRWLLDYDRARMDQVFER